MQLRKKVYLLLSSMCMALAMSMKYPVAVCNQTEENERLQVMKELWEAFSGQTLYGTILFGLFVVVLYRYYDRIMEEATVLMSMVALFFSIMMAIGMSISDTGTFLLLYKTRAQVIKTMLLILGYWMFYLYAASLLYGFSKERIINKSKVGTKFFGAQPFLRPFLTILVVWIPQVIVKYPGAMCYDSYYQLYQYFGLQPFTSHHPPFHTWLIGSFAWMGKRLGSMEAGIFLFVLLQTICFVAILSYTFCLLQKWKVPAPYRALLLILYCTVPYYGGYTGVVIKDVPYAMSFLLYTVCVTELIESTEQYCRSKKELGLYILSAALVMLFRNNGVYVVLPMTFALLLYFGIRYKKNRKMAGLVISLLLLPVIAYYLINHMLISVYDIEKGSKREMLSIPFQQTARYVRDYGEEITEEEKVAIDAVLSYDTIGERYDPRISDPVKGTYREEATREELSAYFHVWWQQFLKHPRVYWEATCSSIYGLFSPNVDNYLYYEDTENNFDEEQLLSLKSPEGLEDKRQETVMVYKLLHEVPGLSLFSNIGFYVIIVTFLAAFLIKEKWYRYLILLIPNALSIAIGIASPVILGHPRYLFPVVYTVPILFLFYRSKMER